MSAAAMSAGAIGDCSTQLGGRTSATGSSRPAESPRGLELAVMRVGVALTRWAERRTARLADIRARRPVLDHETVHRLRAVESEREQREQASRLLVMKIF